MRPSGCRESGPPMAKWSFRDMKTVVLFCALVVLAGCAGRAANTAVGAVPATTAAVPTTRTSTLPSPSKPSTADARGAAFKCLPTPAQPAPADLKGAPPFPLWYSSADGKLLMGTFEVVTAGGAKVPWIRPSIKPIALEGKRLDAEAPPAHLSQCSECYSFFIATALIFPTEGCWQVTARVNDSALSVVMQVAPPPTAARPVKCDTLEDAIRSSDAIVLANVKQVESSAAGYAWVEADTGGVLLSPYMTEQDFDTSLAILQDTRTEPALKPASQTLVMLQRDPWRTVCGAQTLSQVVNDTLVPLSPNAPGWMRDLSLQALKSKIHALTPGTSATPASTSGQATPPAFAAPVTATPDS